MSVRPEGEFLNSDNFVLDGLLDSFDIVILVSDLDKKFNISIEGIDIIANNFINLESITNLVMNYSKNK